MDVHSHNQQALDAYENVLEHLREKHIRITETRKAIISYMIRSTEHPSADKIYRDLKDDFPNMSLATVYNNLKVLVDEGFVSEIKISNDLTTYYDFMGHQHVNAVCEICGKIADFMDVDVMDVAKEAFEQTGYQITRIPIIAYGICPDCQKKAQKRHF
ncbi:transcriptional repressor [Streptococcus iniae]|uniref:peroxide-responsive transcriptional repressor PerR n=1 Tax=Streptococcus iniae TaxID=1346 RepID=UPI0008DB1417|nr:peroxide-responsive transcriptional repressor PerR [Streptococcus iniae]OHX28271.1 transcriptional repressor [Streptococcus iniae]RLV26930.1 transcriptional repressor [Streptococcus iniae]